jgi:hypothetical protein
VTLRRFDAAGGQPRAVSAAGATSGGDPNVLLLGEAEDVVTCAPAVVVRRGRTLIGYGGPAPPEHGGDAAKGKEKQ